jgi:purine nucleosidase
MGNSNEKQAKRANDDVHNQIRKQNPSYQEEPEEYPTASTNYKYKDVRMPYRTEVLEISEEEEKIMRNWLELSKQNRNEQVVPPVPAWNPQNPTKTKIIFDTDIGTDVDDSLALLMLLHCPEADFELLGITTAYGHTYLRAMVTEKIMNGFKQGPNAQRKILGPDFEVIAGDGIPLGTHRPIWHTGFEGAGVYEEIKEIDEVVAQSRKNNAETTHRAGKFIVDQVNKYPGEVVVLSLGAMTNVATALNMDPTLVTKIKQVVFMGMGNRMKAEQSKTFEWTAPDAPIEPEKVFYYYPNHNISCDTLGCMQVFRSGVKITVVNDTVTNKLWFEGPACDELRYATEPAESEVVGRLLYVWLAYRSSIFFRDVNGTCPHDPLTVAEALYPERFVEYVQGHLMIHEWAGFPTFVMDPLGPHRIGLKVKREEFLAFLAEKLRPTAFKPKPEKKNDGDE